LSHVLFDHPFNKLIVFRGALLRFEPLYSIHGRPDFGEQGCEVSKLGSVAGTLHRTARTMAQHKDKLGAGEFGRELHGTDLVLVFYIPRHTTDKDVSNSLIKDQLDWNPGINAGQHNGFRILALSGVC